MTMRVAGGRQIRRAKVLALLACACLLLFTLYATSFGQDAGPAAGDHKHILVLHSYHLGLTWTDDITEGIFSIFDPKDPNVEIHVEHMDTKRYFDGLDGQYIAGLRETYKNKYSSIRIDIIISSDDNTFQFLLMNHKELFPGTPIVFCGVNDFSDAMLEGHEDITGVLESLDQEASIDLALKLHPEARRVAVITDTSTTGQGNRKVLERIATGKKGKAEFIFLDEKNSGMTLPEMLESLKSLPEDAVVYYSDYLRNINGYVDQEKTVPQLSSASQRPIYTHYDEILGLGVVGGKLVNGYSHGRTAAGMAKKILQGTPVADLPVQKESINTYMFDYHQLKRFGIAAKDLPEESVIINKPFSFFETYGYLVWLAAGVIGALSVLVIVLFSNIVRRRSAEDGLRQAHGMLEQRVEERTSALSEANRKLQEEAFERGQAEAALKESEIRFRNFFENAPDAIFIGYSDTGIIADANPAAESMLGRPKGEIVGMHQSQLHPPEKDAFSREGFESHVRSNDQTIPTENTVMRSDGKEIPVEILASNIQFKGRAALMGVFRDLTLRKMQEEEIKQRDAHLRSFFKNAAVGIAVADPRGHYLQVNDQYLEMFGYESRDQLFLGTVGEVTHPEDRPSTREAQKNLALGKIDCYKAEKRFLRQDGSTFWGLVSVSPIREPNGIINAFTAIITDITEQKENRELLTNILESVGEGFIVVDREMKIISANRAYCETMKEDAAAIVGRHCFEVSHRTTRPCYEEGETCPVHETFKTGQKRIAMHVHHDSMNQQKWVEVRSFPIMTSTGEVASVIEVINDVTEKRKLEEQLFRSQRMEAVGNLAGGIAHDFNNILTAIHGSCSLMDWEIDAHSPLREHTRIISEASGRAKELIKNLLAFSRKQIMNRQSVDLNRIVTGIQELLRPTIGENIELIVHKHDSLLTVNVDIGQIEQVLMNLAVNSRDAMPDGGTIAIELKRLFIDEDFVSTKGFGFIGPFALLTFMDSGHGMEEKIRSNIFEPFFTTKGKERGTGLGLSTVYGIIKQHGAFIDVATEQNKGTTFSIYIPLVPDESIAETKSDESPLEKGKETILLVEDEEAVRQITRKILAKYGYNIVEAADGQEAVETFRKYGEKIDLLLTDIVLPKKSGTAICDEIRELRPGLKVLFISGYSAKHSNNQEVLDQSTLFLAKPFTPAQLLQQVRKVLDS